MTLFGKKECCLCDQALELIEKVQRSCPFAFEKIDISGDPALQAEFGLKIPVVVVDGVPAFKYRVNENRLRALLQ